jgi:hypothetical protein
MASSKKTRAVVALDPAALEAAVQSARERLLAEGAIKLSSLQPTSAREGIQARLVADGFEASRSWLRRPIAEQLSEALAQGATVAKKSLASVVRGASAAELNQALAEAERAGRLRRVLRGKLEAFTGADTPVLAAAQISPLRTLLSGLEKALAQAVRKKSLTLLRSDVAEALEHARRILGETAPQPAAARSRAPALGARVEAAAEPAQDTASLLAALDATRDERTGLSFVPKLVTRLLPAMPLAVAQGVLLAAARRELIELRPEGGLNRLAPEELELCPPGPGGTRLSWARRVDGSQP